MKYTATFQNGIRARTFYYKVSDMTAAVTWWSQFLHVTPHKSMAEYSEFKLNDFRIGFVLNSFGDVYTGNRGTLMLECETEEHLQTYLGRARELGAKEISNNLDDISLHSVILQDPLGNEFELGNLNHD